MKEYYLNRVIGKPVVDIIPDLIGSVTAVPFVVPVEISGIAIDQATCKLNVIVLVV